MRVVLQNVLNASVKIDNVVCASIQRGYVLFLGIGAEDNEDIADKLVEKIRKLRIFKDEMGKTNLSIEDVSGSLLVVSQFTLYADCRKGNRPSFKDAESPENAKLIYEYFLQRCKAEFTHVEHGEFGADMKVELINEGPFTIILDGDTLFL